MEIYELSDINIDQNTFYVIDIDGVMCRSYHWEIDGRISEDEWFEAKKTLSCERKSVEFVKELERQNVEYCFVTGRKEASRRITEEMFIKADLVFCIHNIHYNYNEHYDFDKYMSFKIESLLRLQKKGKKTVAIDDFLPFIDSINQLKVDSLQGIYFCLPYLNYKTKEET